MTNEREIFPLFKNSLRPWVDIVIWIESLDGLDTGIRNF